MLIAPNLLSFGLDLRVDEKHVELPFKKSPKLISLIGAVPYYMLNIGFTFSLPSIGVMHDGIGDRFRVRLAVFSNMLFLPSALMRAL